MIKKGDTFTIAGVYRNKARKWWQLWKPKYVSVPEKGLQTFKVVEE